MRSLALALLLCGCGTPPATTPPTDQTIMVSTGAFTVDAGTELTRCMYLPLPSDGDLAVHRFEAHMRPGSHHFNFFYLPPGITPPEPGLGPCTESLRIFLAGSQWQDLDQSLPDGLGFKIPKGSWLALESHFVNATDAPAQGGVDVTLHLVDEAKVQNWVGVYFNIMNGIKVPPSTQQTLVARCPAFADTNVFLMTSHMHHFGSEFDINLFDGAGNVTPLYASTDFEHPKVDDISAAPLVLGANQGFEWKCHYTNDRNTTLYGGDSALDNEMCMMVAFYWPQAPGAPYCFADATVGQ